MLKNGEWEIVIGNNPNNDHNLATEIWKGKEMFAFITGTGEKRKITWYKTGVDIDIPFDWFFEAMQIAKDRVS